MAAHQHAYVREGFKTKKNVQLEVLGQKLAIEKDGINSMQKG